MEKRKGQSRGINTSITDKRGTLYVYRVYGLSMRIILLKKCTDNQKERDCQVRN